MSVFKICGNNLPIKTSSIKTTKESIKASPQMTELCSSDATEALRAKALVKPSVPNKLANVLQKASNAHLNTKGTEYFDQLSENSKKIVDKFNIAHDDVVSIHGILKHKLTDFDTKSVIEARYKTAVEGSLDVNSLSEEQLRKIYKKFEKNFESFPKEKSMVIVTGRGGAGKSTIIKEEGISKTHLLMDADIVKEEIPGYKEKGANYVHKASVAINDALFEEALSKGTNVVFSTTGWHDYLETLMNKAHNSGYKIKLIHCNIDMDKSVERAINRFEVGEKLADGTIAHRYVEPAYIQKGTYVDTIVEKFKDHPYITENILVYDNNKAYPPKLVDEIVKK